MIELASLAGGYQFNVYALAPLIAAFVLQSLAIFVVSYERGTRSSWVFFLFCSVINVWLFSCAMVYFSKTRAVAYFWGLILRTGVCFIPTAIYTFTVTIADVDQWQKSLSNIAWGISAIFVLLPLATDNAYEGIYQYFWGYYPDYGDVEVAFLVYFAIILSLNLQIYWKKIVSLSDEPVARKRYLTFFIGFATAYLASIDFLPAFGIQVYPFGYVFILMFCFIVALGIWRYRLVDFTPAFVASETLHTMNDPLLVCDLDGTVKMVNESFEAVLGYETSDLKDESIGKIFVDPSEASDFISQIQNMSDVSDIQTLKKKNGDTFRVDISSTVLTDQESNSVGVVIVARDLSEILNEREKISLLQRISEAANEADSVESAFNTVLTYLCDFQNWELAHAFRQESLESKNFVSIQVLHGSDSENRDEFLHDTKTVVENPRHGLEDVLQDGVTVYHEDLANADSDRLSKLEEIGYKSGLIIPIELNSDTVAAIEFYTRDKLIFTTETEEIIDYTIQQLARVIERERAQTVEKAFRHYVPSSVMKRALDSPESLKLGGDRREITVLFADLAQFTSFSQNRSAKEVAFVLNRVLTQITECVFNEDGVLDKYIGDALLAEFGILPEFEPGNHAKRACFAALDMIHAMKELHNQWDDEDKNSLKLKLGIHTGEAATGNMGSEVLFDFTAVGDTMNTGARLEQANKRFGSYCLISEATYEQVQDEIEARCLGDIIFKGRREPLTVYELIGRADEIDPSILSLIEDFEAGLNYYQNRNWERAFGTFDELSQEFPDDVPIRLFKSKSNEYRESPPSEQWSAVEEISS